VDEQELIYVPIIDCEHAVPSFPVVELFERWPLRHAEEHHPEWVDDLRVRMLNGTLTDTPTWACAALDAAKATFTDEDALESRIERSKVAVRAAAERR
jgi:hypothetical protein